MTELDPLNPGHHCCASCWYYAKDSGTPAWCPAAFGLTDPAFLCEDWRDCRERTDPMTGEPWPELAAAPLYRLLPPKDGEPILPKIPGFKDE